MKSGNVWSRSWLVFWAVFSAFSLLALVPFLACEWLAFPDSLNHLARLHLLTGQVPDGWQRYYVVYRDLIPNMAMDVMAAQWVSMGLSPAVAFRVFMALTVLLLPLGAVAIAAAVNRRPPWLALLAFGFVYHRFITWGFLNYTFALGVALLVMAGWLRATAPGVSVRRQWCWALGTAAVLMGLVVAHLVGWGLAVAGVLLCEIGRLAGGQRMGRERGVSAALALAAVLPGFLWYAVGFAHDRSMSVTFEPPRAWLFGKATALVTPFYSYSLPVAVACTVVFLGVLGVGLRRAVLTRAAWPVTAWLPLLGMVVLFLVLPASMMGSHFLDKRIWIMVAVLAVALPTVVLTPRQAVLAVLVTAMLLGVKTAEVTRASLAMSRIVGEIRQSLQAVPVGSRLTGLSFSNSTSMEYPPLRHVASLAAADRAALVPGLFARPFDASTIGFQPSLHQKAPMRFFNLSPEDSAVLLDACAHFDHVLLTYEARAPQEPACLQPLVRGAHFGLYRVVR